jgi:hypothetical protein
MSQVSFVPTPLFQLNLMLFLTWPAPPSFVEPIFQREGFVLRSIAPSIGVPLDALLRVQAASLPIRPTVSPNVLLEQSDQQQLLLIECKLSSFGPESSTSQQARALLACHGSYLAERIGVTEAADWKVYLLYAVGGGQEGPMQDTIQALSQELHAARISTADGGAVGIHIRADGVYLSPDVQSNIPVQTLRQAPSDGVRVMALEEGEDPRPLYLIPLDPSIGTDDPVERQVVEERVRQALTSLIGSRLDMPSFEVTMDEILTAVTEVWHLWQDKKAAKCFSNAVRAYVKQVLRQVRRLGAQIKPHPRHFAFSQVTPKVARDLRRYLSSATFRRGEIDLWSEGVQLDFSSLAEGW